MLRSSLALTRALTVATLSLALSACNLPAPKELTNSATVTTSDAGKTKEERAANFTLQAMPDKSKTLETKSVGNFALPNEKVYNFQACAKSVSYDKPIVGHDFLVEETSQKVTSDKSGCITWSETIPYNYLGDSKYLRLTRKVRGLGLQKGAQIVSFAINPWGHGEMSTPILNPDDGNRIPTLVDDPEEVSLALNGFSADHKSPERSLWVEDGRLFVTEQKLTSKGIVLNVEMRPNVSLQLTKMNGELFQRTLTAGMFKARFKLIHIYQKGDTEIRRQISQSPFMVVRMENGIFALKSPMSLEAIPTRGQLVLGMELEPVGAPQGILDFHGVYFLSEYDKIKGTSFLKLNTVAAQATNFKIEDYVNATLEDVNHDPRTGVVDDETYQKPKIEVAQLDFRFLRVGKETTSTREVFYNIKACLRSGIDQNLTRAHTFKVTKFSAAGHPTSTVSLKTDNNSCLIWDEAITFNYFECQHYLKGNIKIESPDLAMNESLGILVNPWEISSGTAIRDMRYVNPQEALVLNCRAEQRARSQVMVDSYSYNTLSYGYAVDSFMNLQMTKKIQFRLDPRLLVYSSMANGRGEAQKFRDGVYLLRLAVVQNADYDSQKNTYVASAEKLVNVISGQIMTEISFTTQDLKALGNRNNLLVEIHPIDDKKVIMNGSEVTLRDTSKPLSSVIDTQSLLESPTFIGPIVLNVDDSTRSLRLVDSASISSILLTGAGQNINHAKNIVQQVIDQGKKALTQRQHTIQTRGAKQNFLKENNLQTLDLSTADAQRPLIKAFIGESALSDELMVTKADLKKLLNTGTLAPDLAHKLCAFWSADHFKQMYAAKGGVLWSPLNILGHQCMQMIRKDPKSFFQVEKKIFAKEVGGSKYLKGTNHGLVVGTNFSLSNATSNFTSRSTSLSVKAGLSKKFLDVFSVGLDLGYSLSWGQTNSTGNSNTMSVSTSTSMTVQQNTFAVRINKFEQCAVIKLNAGIFMPKKGWFQNDLLGTLNPRLTEPDMVDATTRGIMICDGVVQSTPITIQEDYYLIAQETSSTQMQDNGDARNRNFFIALRSTNDFQRFVTALQGTVNIPGSADAGEPMQDQAKDMMLNLFNSAIPSYPGVIHVP